MTPREHENGWYDTMVKLWYLSHLEREETYIVMIAPKISASWYIQLQQELGDTVKILYIESDSRLLASPRLRLALLDMAGSGKLQSLVFHLDLQTLDRTTSGLHRTQEEPWGSYAREAQHWNSDRAPVTFALLKDNTMIRTAISSLPAGPGEESALQLSAPQLRPRRRQHAPSLRHSARKPVLHTICADAHRGTHPEGPTGLRCILGVPGPGLARTEHAPRAHWTTRSTPEILSCRDRRRPAPCRRRVEYDWMLVPGTTAVMSIERDNSTHHATWSVYIRNHRGPSPAHVAPRQKDPDPHQGQAACPGPRNNEAGGDPEPRRKKLRKHPRRASACH